jgi:anaerobic ribonucleoside-triphosphate reductase activating protein
MNIATIKYYDIANGKGVRTSVFVSGCRHHCPNCFNEVAWDFNYGEEYTKDVENKIIESLAPDYIDGISILGGEPFEVENQKDLVILLQKIKNIYPKKTVWIYSGFTFEEIKNGSRASGLYANELLSLCDVLVDGRFIEAQKNISLKFRGSENQRIIDVQKTLQSGSVELYMD